MLRKLFIVFVLIPVFLFSCMLPALADGNWTCPNCGHENPERANFCGSCRAERPVANITYSAANNAWICSSCHEICPDGDSFCLMCGNDRHDTDERAMLIPEQEMETVSFPAARTEEYKEQFSKEDEKDIFEYFPKVSGEYYFCIKDASAGFNAWIHVFDAKEEEQGYGLLTTGYEGFLVEFKAGEKYKFTVTQASGLGGYTVSVGVPNEWADLGNARVIEDSFSYPFQKNRYTFTAPNDGLYYFWISQAMNGFYAWIDVVDKRGETLEHGLLSQDYGYSVELKAGETYSLLAQYNSMEGNYQLKIGSPKNVADISGCIAVGDSLYFPEQENMYTFRAGKDGWYTFTLEKADSGFFVWFYILDQGRHTLEEATLGQGDTIRAELSAGGIYTVEIKQGHETGYYSFRISDD